MKNGRIAAAIVGLALLGVCPAPAEPLTQEQLQAIDTFVNHSLELLKNNADKNIDSALSALAEAYKAGPYASHLDTEAVRHGLIKAGSKLKTDVAAAQAEVKTIDRSRPLSPLIILSKAQVTNIKVTRWLWRVTEISDLALASVGRNGGDASRFLPSMITTLHYDRRC